MLNAIRSRLLVPLLVLGLVAPTLPVVGDCCRLNPAVSAAETADTCCPSQQEQPEDCDCCPSGCDCTRCGCSATTPVILRVVSALTAHGRPAGAAADLDSVLSPQDGAGELLQPPKA